MAKVDIETKKTILRRLKKKRNTALELEKEFDVPRQTIYLWAKEEKIKLAKQVKKTSNLPIAEIHTRAIINSAKEELVEKLLKNLDTDELQFIELILSNYGYKKAYTIIYGEPRDMREVNAKLREPRIQRALIKLNSDLLAHYEIETVPTIIQELNNMLTFDIIDLFEDDMTLKDLKDVPKDVRQSIRKIEKDVVTYPVGLDEHGGKIFESKEKFKIEAYDKLKASDQLSKIYKMYDARNVTNNTTINNNSEGNEIIKGMNKKFGKKPKIINAKVVTDDE